MGVLGTLICAAALVGAEPNGMVLNFSSVRCGPCQMMSPIVTQMSREGLPIRKVDTDHEPDLARHYGITSIPAFVLIVDGKEVTRLIGRQDEAVLRQLVARIPARKPVVVPDLPGANGLLTVSNAARASGPTGPGSSAPRFQSKTSTGAKPAAPRREIQTASIGDAPLGLADSEPEYEADVPEMSPAALEASGKPVRTKGLRNMFAGSTKPAPRTKPALVRGQADSAEAPVVHSPMASTVRIRVSDGQAENFGTGTIVDSRVGRSLIVTCGHIFRDLKPSSRIVVETFADGSDEPTASHIGKVVKYDLESDAGVLSIPAEGLSVTRVASDSYPLIKGMPVQSIGCGGGDRPTVHSMRVTALNRYLGPDNIECDDVPVQGRSGGGLFSKDGQLIGVCTAADTKEQRGIYCGLKAIHKLLDESQLTWLYREGTESLVVQASADEPAARDSDPAADLESDPEQALAAALADSGEAEVVCVIRPIDRPRDSTRVIVINRASPKFLGYLSDEMDSQERVQPTALKESRPAPIRVEAAAGVEVITPQDEFVTEEFVTDETGSVRRARPRGIGNKSDESPKPYRRARSGVE